MLPDKYFLGLMINKRPLGATCILMLQEKTNFFLQKNYLRISIARQFYRPKPPFLLF